MKTILSLALIFFGATSISLAQLTTAQQQRLNQLQQAINNAPANAAQLLGDFLAEPGNASIATEATAIAIETAGIDNANDVASFVTTVVENNRSLVVLIVAGAIQAVPSSASALLTAATTGAINAGEELTVEEVADIEVLVQTEENRQTELESDPEVQTAINGETGA
ncbi:MAG: hypothetical protein AAF555_08565 [Verrucomicrobiota bacterium]